jgi:excisionase family DNA binding protein
MKIKKRVYYKGGGKAGRTNAAPKAPPEGALLNTIDQTARMLGVARVSVYKLLRQGKLESVVCLGRSRRIPRESVERFIRESTVSNASS